MKRTLSFMVMALALLLTQCRKPEVKFPSPVAPEGTTVSMTVTAGPGGKTDISETGAITWSTGDKLYVGFGGEYVGYLTLTSGQNTPTGWFSGNVTLPDGTTGEKTFHFFYLGRDNGVAPSLNATTVDVSFAEQEIYADANSKLANASAHHIGYGTAQGTVAGSEVTGINVTLVSKVALARFSFKKAADGTPYTDALTLSGTNIYNSMTVNFNGSFTHGEQAGNISLTDTENAEKYVMLVPVGTGSETLSFAGEGFEGSTTLGSGIEANKFYRMPDGSAIEVTVTAPSYLPGEFTVDGSGNKVKFSKGNLQYIGSSGTWKFAEHQWDCLGSTTSQGSSSTTVDRDLFGWGCTGYKDPRTSSTGYQKYYQPYSTTTSKGYGPKWDETNKYGLSVNNQSDWGYLAIGTDPAGTWRTLSNDEWVYLLNTRTTATTGLPDASSRYAKVTVNGVTGMLVFPDSFAWDATKMGTAPTQTNTSNTQGFSSGIYTTAQFEEQEKSGVVFLPSAGHRRGTSFSELNTYGYYWSSSCFIYDTYPDDAFHLYWGALIVQADRYDPRAYGMSVRLVR